jgi:hypothetical protein
MKSWFGEIGGLRPPFCFFGMRKKRIHRSKLTEWRRELRFAWNDGCCFVECLIKWVERLWS